MLFFGNNHLATRGGSTLKLWDVRMLNDKKGAVRTWQEGLASSWTAACGRRGDFRRVAPLKGMLVST